MRSAGQIKNRSEGGFKNTLLYTAGGVAIFSGGFLLVRYLIRRISRNIEESKSMTSGDPASYAKRLKMAFDNDGYWGTDMEEVRNTFIEIPTRSLLDEVEKSYRRLTDHNLYADLSSELRTAQYNEILNIIAAKPLTRNSQVDPSQQLSQNALLWAKRLKAAFDESFGIFPGTDEAAIKAVFTEIPTKAAFALTARIYQQQYGSTLDAALRSELEFWEYDDYMRIIKSKP